MTKRSIFSLFLLLLVLLPFSLETTFTIITWTGDAGDNLWSTAGNWSTNTVPSAANQIVVFPKNVTVDTAGADTIIGAIKIKNNSNVALTKTDLTSFTIGTTEKLPKHIKYNISGGQFITDENVPFSPLAGATVSIQGQDGNLVGISALEISGEASSILNFSYSSVGKNPKSNITHIEWNGVNSDTNSATININSKVRFVLSGTSSIKSNLTVKKGGTLLVPSGSDSSNSGNFITIAKGGKVEALGLINLSGATTNNGSITLQSITGGNSFTNLTNNKNIYVNTSGDSTVNFGVGNGFINMGTINLEGTSLGLNIFEDDSVNHGAIVATGSSLNTFGTLINNNQMKFSGDFGGGTVNTFEDTFTNNFAMQFSGLNDQAGAGGSINNFNGALVNARTILCFEDSVNTFAGGITNSGRNAVIEFFGNSTNDFGATVVTNTSKGKLHFYGNSVNTFENTAGLTNNGGSLVYFYGNSNNTFVGTETITNSSTINFYGNSTTTCAHVLDGAGTVNIFGNANLTLSNAANTTTGNINVYQNGTLTLASTALMTGLDQTIFVGKVKGNRGGTLINVSGNATSAKNITLIRNGGGTIEVAANSTFQVTGDFVQNNGTFATHLGAGTNVGLLAISGNAALGGSLLIYPESGFTNGHTFRVLTAASITGLISNVVVNGGGARAALNVSPTTFIDVTLTSISSSLSLPLPVRDLNRDDRSFARFLFRSASKIENHRDAKSVVNQLARQTPKQFALDVKRLKPVIAAAGMKRGLDYKTQFRGFVNSQFLSNKAFYQNALKDRKLKKNQNLSIGDLIAFQRPQSQVFTNSIQEIETVTGLQGKYESKVEGADFGYQKVYSNQLIFENVLSCSTHELTSQNKMGDVSWVSASYAPSVGFLTEKAYAKVMVSGGANFYNQTREIAFAKINRKAKSDYHSLDFLGQISSGYNQEIGGVVFEADLNAAVQNVYTSGYRERGAKSLNLVVLNHNNLEVLADAALKASKRFEVGYTALTPQVYVSYLANQKVGDRAVRARLAILNEADFFKTSQEEKFNQKLVFGSDFSIQRSKRFELAANIELDILKPLENVSARAKMKWMF